MKTDIPLVCVVATAAVCMTGCGGESRDCVDQYGNRRPDRECRELRSGAYPRYVYGGTREGDRVVGGSTTPRGGFGSSGFGGG